MKKIIAILMALVLTAGFAACGNTATKTEDNAGSASDSDVLKVGMECNYAPYNWSQADDSNGAVPIKNVDNMYTNGYDVQVALKIAEALGKKLEIYSYEWDSLIRAFSRASSI